MKENVRKLNKLTLENVSFNFQTNGFHFSQRSARLSQGHLHLWSLL